VATESLERYDVAQICMNGHVINDSTQEYPHRNRKHCHKCGKPTITACPDCGFDIRGEYIMREPFIRTEAFPAPAFCENCGTPYPWTKLALDAARELTDQMPNLTDTEKAEVKADLDDLVVDSPRTKLAASRVKRLLAKAGGELPGMFREVVVSIASDAAKKAFLGG
jgi:hypothetical protein